MMKAHCLPPSTSNDYDVNSNNNNNLAYFCFSRDLWRLEYPRYDWYVLDTHQLTLKKHEQMSDCKLLLDFGCAVLNSNVYIVGGCRRSEITYHLDYLPPENQVQIFDTTLNKWKVGVSMNGTRSSPHVVALNNKLYVFGGDMGKARSVSTWAEYFDGDQWIAVQNTPSRLLYCRTTFGSAVYGNGHYILLWNQDCCCTFDVSTNQWCRLIVAPDPYGIRFQQPDFQIYCTKVAVIDDIIFWYFGNFFAYSLHHNKTLEEPVFSCPKVKPPFKICRNYFLAPILFTTGEDQLCLIWYENTPKDDSFTILEFSDERMVEYRENRTLNFYRMNFQVERLPSSSPEPSIVLRPLQDDPIVSTIKACSIQGFAGTFSHNYGKIICDCHGVNPPESSSSSNPVDHLPQSMYDLNYWQWLLEEEVQLEEEARLEEEAQLEEEVQLEEVASDVEY